ncbi:MAG: hypothetical protein LBU35_02285 [Holosporales bacterium]|nr:hypothetical protein [Holosporales bacterium]
MRYTQHKIEINNFCIIKLNLSELINGNPTQNLENKTLALRSMKRSSLKFDQNKA